MFRNAVDVAEIGGFRIRIDPSWLVIAALVVWSLGASYFPEVLPGVSVRNAFLLGLAGAVGLFASVILHELAHSVVARRYGLEVGAITLFVFGGVAELTEEPHDARSEWRIAIAGPLASLALAGGFQLLAMGLSGIGAPVALVVLASYLAFINAILALFNLVPAFPLDGGRVLRALLWGRTGDLVGSTRIAARAGTVFGIFLILSGALVLIGVGSATGLWQILIGFFVVGASRATYEQTKLHAALKGRTVAAIMTRDPVAVSPDASVASLIDDVMLGENVSFVPVVEDGRAVGYVTAMLTRLIDPAMRTTTSVRRLMEPVGRDVAVPPNTPLDEVMHLLVASPTRKLMVIDAGRLVGIVTFADVQTMLAIREGLAGAFDDPAVPLSRPATLPDQSAREAA